MYTDRPLLKNNAKTIIKTAKPSMLTAAVIYVLVFILLTTLSQSVMGVNISYDDAMSYVNYYLNGDYQAVIRMSEEMTPPTSAYLLNLVISAVLYIFGAGFLIFIFNTVKNAGAVYGNLLDGFGLAGKLILLALVQGVFVFLWSLLFVIPGIIAAYRYSLAVYIMIDHPELSAMDCIRESKRMTQGFKSQLFLLDLSFILWLLLSSLPVIGYAVQVYLTPYMETSKALYYEQIRVQGSEWQVV